MTDSNYTEIIFICDRSYSMSEMADPPHTKAERSNEGVRQIVADNKALPGRVRFSLADFDIAFQWIAQAEDDLSWTCHPRGSTALLDAVARGITETGERLEKMPEDERPGRVIVVVATDGEENSSREVKSRQQVADMVKHQTDVYGWDFVFIGAEVSAFAEAGSMGFSAGSTLPSSNMGTHTAYAMSSNAIVRSRITGQSVSYTDDERQQVEDAGKPWRTTK